MLISILSNEIINILNDNKYFEDIEEYVDCISDEKFFERLRIREKKVKQGAIRLFGNGK